ncbi:hypothetical protein XMG59_002298 [Marinobacterium sp. xm-g-59]|jgi:predicted DNA-binding transcriptional regulator AlpA|uniref:helix-turn-helix transcriptional regulator n=1 Tax=Marinobacterium sp. xm-g-59 TaxID=2497748 RepID=UPI00156A3B77|nr:DNA-binding protein [Marinobacterium sp. xm-g-59]NRP96179.1 hypothetical protein [Marinobacterium sp. xm-g-59]
MKNTLTINQGERLIRARELKKILGISSDATLWRWIQSGKLPEPNYINACRVWRESDLNDAIGELMSDASPVTPMSR